MDDAGRKRLSMVAIGFLVALGVVGVATFRSHPSSELVSYRRTHLLADGLELVELEYDLTAGRRGAVRAWYADPAKVTLELALNPTHAPLASVSTSAMVVTNASFFTPDFRPTGLLVSNGKVLAPFVREAGSAGSGVFVLEGGVPDLIERDAVSNRSFFGASIALQAGPRVIERDGRPGIRKDDGATARRTVIGKDARGFVAIAVITGGSEPWAGPSLFDLQRILGREGLGATTRPELAFEFALNLDGGPSTGFDVRHPSIKMSLAEGSPVLSVLALTPKPR